MNKPAMNKPAAAHPSRNLPSRRALLAAWAILMALTVGTMLAGHVTSSRSLGLAWTTALLAISWAKARTILAVYLNLRAAPRGWQSGFNGALIFLLLLLLGLYAIGAAGLIPR